MPGWCDFFDDDEYAEFDAAVTDALSLYGAENQDISEGYVELAAGDPRVEVHPFPLAGLAARCRQHPPADWPDLCASQVCDWSEGAPQREWLTGAPFPVVAPLLELWLTHEPELSFQDDPLAPDQPFSVRLADGLHASLVVEVPELAETPELPAFVPRSAVTAWGRDRIDLLAAARGRLRHLPPPTWHVRALPGTGVEVRMAAAPAGFALLLDEVGPPELRTGPALLAAPTRNLLVLADPDTDVELLRPHVQAAWSRAADPISPLVYRRSASGALSPAR